MWQPHKNLETVCTLPWTLKFKKNFPYYLTLNTVKYFHKMTTTIPMEAQCNNVLATKHTDSFSLPLAMSMWISHQSQLQNISVDNPWSQSFISFSNTICYRRGMRKCRSMKRDTTSWNCIADVLQPLTRYISFWSRNKAQDLCWAYAHHIRTSTANFQHSHHRASFLPSSLLHFFFFFWIK